MKYFIGIVVALFLVAAAIQVPYQMNRDTTVATVGKSERVCSGGQVGTCRYLVFTDRGVFENTDSLWNMKFDSSDMYAKISPNKTYEFYVVGWRIPFLSMYKNILNIREENHD